MLTKTQTKGRNKMTAEQLRHEEVMIELMDEACADCQCHMADCDCYDQDEESEEPKEMVF